MFRRPKHLSRKGAEFIARFEGFRSRAYNDAAGNATIGYGHMLHFGPCTARDHLQHWTKEHALEVLMLDADKAAAAVRKINPPLRSQARFDAIVSAVFNLGPGVLEKNRSLGKALNTRLRLKVPSAL